METLKKETESNIFYFSRWRQRRIKKYTKLWNETKNQIKALNGDEPIKYK